MNTACKPYLEDSITYLISLKKKANLESIIRQKRADVARS